MLRCRGRIRLPRPPPDVPEKTLRGYAARCVRHEIAYGKGAGGDKDLVCLIAETVECGKNDRKPDLPASREPGLGPLQAHRHQPGETRIHTEMKEFVDTETGRQVDTQRPGLRGNPENARAIQRCGYDIPRFHAGIGAPTGTLPPKTAATSLPITRMNCLRRIGILHHSVLFDLGRYLTIPSILRPAKADSFIHNGHGVHNGREGHPVCQNPWDSEP